MSTGVLSSKDELHQAGHVHVDQSEVLKIEDLLNDAFVGENEEHEQGVWTATKAHPWACIWAFIMSFTIVMESFDLFLNGNFAALPAFQEHYGTFVKGPGYTIPTKWQSALFQSGQCGAFVGVFLAGPITNRLGCRWTTILGLILMNATIFSKPSTPTPSLFLWLGKHYKVFHGASLSPTPPPTPMSWSIGGIIVAGVTYAFNKRSDQWSWRVPLALQWVFPTPLLILIFVSHESPWWIIRRGRKAEALRSIERLGCKSSEQAQQKIALIERTRLSSLSKPVSIPAVLSSSTLINSCLQFIANAGSWFLAAWFGRRAIYLWGTITNVTLLMTLGICASIKQSEATNYAQAVLGIVISFVYAGALGPISYTIISETSSVRLRALSTGVGRAAYYIAEIPMMYLASQLLNPTGWNLAGKCGYVWGGPAIVCWIMAYFFLPELKHRSYRETDILFNHRDPARKFKTTVINVKHNE
ncbi:hypothetical protein ACJ41O_009028 [Fusarium nematophilum]